MSRRTVPFLLVALFLNQLFVTPTLAQSPKTRDPINLGNVDQLKALITIDTGEEYANIAINPDGSKLAVANRTTGLKVYDIKTGKVEKQLTDKPVSRAIYSADGKLIAGYVIACQPGTCSGTVYVLETATGKERLSIPVDGILDLPGFSPDGKKLAYSEATTTLYTSVGLQETHAGPSTLHIVDIETSKETQRFDEADAILSPLFFSPDGGRIAYAATPWTSTAPSINATSLHIIDLKTGKNEATLTAGLLQDMSSDWSLAFTLPFDKYNGMVGMLEEPWVFDLKTGKPVVKFTKGELSFVAFSHDSKIMAVSGGDTKTTISLREITTNRELLPLSIAGVQSVYMSFSPDGTLLAAPYESGGTIHVIIWGIPQ